MVDITKQDDVEEKVQEDREKKEVIKLATPLDSNYPLLKEFREKAPGSHKHAQSLVSMIDNVCSEADVDTENLKIAAMYHDIGKMWAPEFFTENQPDENIHDNIDPLLSYHLITRHVSDTIAILFANNFPTEVIRIAGQHHGTTLLSSISKKAKSIDKDVDENLFRYKTDKPDSIEALILMLCDQVEATSRSYYLEQGRTNVDPAVFVINIYNNLHSDGQFDNVQVFLGQLKKIQSALISDVSSNFQKRIKYDEDDELAKEK